LALPQAHLNPHAAFTAMQVLYVDDDRLNGVLFAEVCALIPGLQLEVVDDPVQALELAPRWLKQQPHSLLVMDLHLPETDGMTLLKNLRHLGVMSPAVLFTADEPHAALRQRATEAGFVALWPKPLNPTLLLAALRQAAAGGRLE
jgi:CheY-like chemotaxis protein